MVASLNNTMARWRAVRNALRRANRGKLRRTWHVREHNAPTTYQEVWGHYNNAFANAPFNNMGDPVITRAFFEAVPNSRQHITAAYNKLNAMARELAMIRRKAVAVSVIQRHWRRARPEIRRQRRITALRALTSYPGVSNTRRIAFELAFPKPVYGPIDELTHLRSSRKYNRY